MFKSCCVCVSKKVIESHPGIPAGETDVADVKNTNLESSKSNSGVKSSTTESLANSKPQNGSTVSDLKLDCSLVVENSHVVGENLSILNPVSCANGKLDVVEIKTGDEHLSSNPLTRNMETCNLSQKDSSKVDCEASVESKTTCESSAKDKLETMQPDEGSTTFENHKIPKPLGGNNSVSSFCSDLHEATAEESDDEDSELSENKPQEIASCPETSCQQYDGPRRASSGGILKRPSIAWPAEEKPRNSVRMDVSDDDEVFCSPPSSALLALRKQSLPAGLGGGAVGRDELALRRHRVFSELVGAARAAAEHRVRFDPLGPLVASGADNHPSQQVASSDLERLLDRLEQVVSRLERVAGVLPCSSPPPPPPPPPEDTSSVSEESGTVSPSSPVSNSQEFCIKKMSVQGYTDITQGPLAQYISLSNDIGGEVASHAGLVNKAFQAQMQYLTMASQSGQPPAAQQQSLLMPTSLQIQAVQEFREKHRASPLFNHLSAISESIPALGWVAVSPTPAPYVKEMNDAGQFYTNRVLKDWKEKDKKHVEWCKSWIQTLTDLQAFIKQHHTTGLVWGGKGSCPPPPPCGLPPPPPCPPPMADFGSMEDGGGADDRSALFAQINQGEDITKSLKKVTSDMQTHKNTTLREGPAPFKAPPSAPKPFAKALPTPGSGQIDKPPVFTRDGKKWLIEHHKGNQSLLVENAEMNNVVYMFKCRESALTVKGKINSIVLDSCTKCAVVFESVVSSIEFVNCQSVQMQVLGKVPTISIDKTDGCQMYLSADSLNVEVVSSKSSEMNVLLPKGNGDYTELPIPEQFKTTVNKALSSLNTVAVESKG